MDDRHVVVFLGPGPDRAFVRQFETFEHAEAWAGGFDIGVQLAGQVKLDTLILSLTQAKDLRQRLEKMEAGNEQ